MLTVTTESEVNKKTTSEKMDAKVGESRSHMAASEEGGEGELATVDEDRDAPGAKMRVIREALEQHGAPPMHARTLPTMKRQLSRDDEVAAMKRPERAPIAVLAIDVETHGWIDEEEGRSGFVWEGQFGKPAWRSKRQLEFSRVVQLGWCSFDADGSVLERHELCVSDAPPCEYKAVAFHHLTDSMLRSKGIPIADVLARLLVTLRAVAWDGGTLVSHGLEFDAGILREEYRRIASEGDQLLTQLARFIDSAV